jgi:hypothetical protein
MTLHILNLGFSFKNVDATGKGQNYKNQNVEMQKEHQKSTKHQKDESLN